MRSVASAWSCFAEWPPSGSPRSSRSWPARICRIFGNPSAISFFSSRTSRSSEPARLTCGKCANSPRQLGTLACLKPHSCRSSRMKTQHIPREGTVVSEKPYRFIHPHRSEFWPRIFAPFIPRLLARKHGITSWEVAGAEHVRASQQTGHGVLIVPNHPSPSDPVVLGLAARALHCNLHVMASAHVFQQSRFKRWLLPRLGVFSVYREGMDREALKVAIEILASAQRPLVIFGEGVITRTNDRLVPLQDGLSFIARAAAKAAAERRPGGRVVVHALALRYRFYGDVDAVLRPALERIERRLSWQPQRDLTTTERVIKIGHSLLALKAV